MAKKKRQTEDMSDDMDMTPMIDIVFLLIIFFMVVTEIVKATVEEIELPVASMTVEDQPSRDKKLIVNILADGTIKIGGAVYEPNEILDAFFDHEASLAGFEDDPMAMSRIEMTVRADKDCEWQYVQKLFESSQKAKIYKVRMASSKEFMPPGD